MASGRASSGARYKSELPYSCLNCAALLNSSQPNSSGYHDNSWPRQTLTRVPVTSRYDPSSETYCGDKQFENRDQLVAFVGLDIRTKESGQWKGRRRLSKRGNGYIRKVLFQIGWGLMMNHPEYNKKYIEMRTAGKNYKTAIVALARKFLRFMFAFHWKKSITPGPPAPCLERRRKMCLSPISAMSSLPAA
jgi:hypothetical protein